MRIVGFQRNRLLVGGDRSRQRTAVFQNIAPIVVSWSAVRVGGENFPEERQCRLELSLPVQFPGSLNFRINRMRAACWVGGPEQGQKFERHDIPFVASEPPDRT